MKPNGSLFEIDSDEGIVSVTVERCALPPPGYFENLFETVDFSTLKKIRARFSVKKEAFGTVESFLKVLPSQEIISFEVSMSRVDKKNKIPVEMTNFWDLVPRPGKLSVELHVDSHSPISNGELFRTPTAIGQASAKDNFFFTFLYGVLKSPKLEHLRFFDCYLTTEQVSDIVDVIIDQSAKQKCNLRELSIEDNGKRVDLAPIYRLVTAPGVIIQYIGLGPLAKNEDNISILLAAKDNLHLINVGPESSFQRHLRHCLAFAAFDVFIAACTYFEALSGPKKPSHCFPAELLISLFELVPKRRFILTRKQVQAILNFVYHNNSTVAFNCFDRDFQDVLRATGCDRLGHRFPSEEMLQWLKKEIDYQSLFK